MILSSHLPILSLILSMIGILSLEIIALTSTPISLQSLSDIQPEMIGKNISIQGTISWKENGKNAIQFGIQNETEMIAIKFNPSLFEKLLSPGDQVNITGKLQPNHGKTQILIQKIEVDER